MGEDIDYKDPHIVQQVALWSGLEAPFTSDKHVIVVAPGDGHYFEVLCQPWRMDRSRWQLNHVLNRLDQEGLFSSFEDTYNKHWPVSSKTHYILEPSERIWKPLVDTLVETGEVELDE